MSMRKTALITGASQGIGASLAFYFAQKGYDLILTARSRSGLEKTAGRVFAAGLDETSIHIFPADLAEKGAVEKLMAQIGEKKLDLDVLVNNAGFGFMGDFADQNLSDAVSMIDVNISALVALSRLCFEPLRKRQGGILNVSSIVGFMPVPGSAVYAASKAFVRSFSEALYQEGRVKGVHVSILCPGANKTGFFKRAHIYKEELLPKFLTRHPDWTARLAVQGFLRKKRVIIPGFWEKLALILVFFLPKPLILFFLDRFTRTRKTP